MNIIRKLFTLVILSAAFVAGVRAQDIQANANLDKSTIRLGDQTILHLSVRLPKGQQVVFPQLKDTLTSKISIVTISRLDTIPDQQDNNRVNISQNVTITGFDAGTYNIPAIPFKTAMGSIQSNPLKLTIDSVKVDTTKAIYDIKQPITVSYTLMDLLKSYWPWVVFPLLAIIIGLLLYRYYKNRPKQEAVISQPKVILPAHAIAVKKLKELRERKLWQSGEVKMYYTEMTEILKEYLEKRFTIKTHEQTTDEIMTSLRNADLNDENRDRLGQVLNLSDLVKFAKERPLAPENEHTLDTAISFVQGTQLHTPEPETPKEGGQPS